MSNKSEAYIKSSKRDYILRKAIAVEAAAYKESIDPLDAIDAEQKEQSDFTTLRQYRVFGAAAAMCFGAFIPSMPKELLDLLNKPVAEVDNVTGNLTFDCSLLNQTSLQKGKLEGITVQNATINGNISLPQESLNFTIDSKYKNISRPEGN
jgi:hypothetical protein